MTTAMRVEPTLAAPEAARRPWDAVIIGAGPAGSVAAAGLAHAGRRVLLLDRSRFPRWKVCGCTLNAGGVAVVRRLLAAAPGAIRTCPLDHVELASGPARARLPLAGSAAVSREDLDAALVRCAIDAGADFLDEARAAAVSPAPHHAQVILGDDNASRTLSARLVLVAGGLCGLELPGLPAPRLSRTRVGLGATLDAPPFLRPGAVSMTIGRRGYVGAVLLPDGRTNLAAAISPRLIREAGPAAAAACILESAGHEWAPLALAARWRGTAPLTRTRRRVAAGRILLLGDAAGYIEPFTGEGITWALRCGDAAAGIAARILAGEADATAWQRWWARDIRPAHRRCALVAFALRAGPLTRLAVRALGAAPRAAAPLASIFGSGRVPAMP
ncbi:MAG: FAD-dependent monooxygenase [Phycisphaerales bacterium]